MAGHEGVLRIDPNTGVKSAVAPHLQAAAIAPAGERRAFVSNGWDGVNPVPTSGQPRIAFTDVGAGVQPPIQPTGLVYVAGTLWVVLDAKRAVLPIDQYAINSGYSNSAQAIPVGRSPAHIAYGEGSIWVDSRGDGTVSQVDPAKRRVVRTIHLGYRPSGLAVGAGAVWASARRVSATAAATGLLAFDDHGQIYTSRPDGSGRKQLTHTDAPLQNIEPAWSPDGRRIAFLRVRGGKQSTAYAYTPLSLYIMNADGSQQHAIPHTSDLFGGAPAWSPDGTRIAFDGGSPFRIYTIRIDGTHRMRIPGIPAKSADPTWSPDGTQIGFDTNWHPRNGSLYRIYAIHPNGTQRRRLAAIPSEYMQWSPDGRRIIFNRYRSDGTVPGEFIAPDSVGGPGIRLLPPTNQYNGKPGPSVVSWSPDGTAIVVSGVVDEFPSRSTIYIANSDGTGLTFVTRGNDATWSPAG